MLTEPTVHPASLTVADARELFCDDHMHMALLVDAGRLVATVERSDLERRCSASARATTIGALQGRVVGRDDLLTDAEETMRMSGRRRLAVTDDRGLLVGLLCLTRRGTGFCSDEDVRSRRAGRCSSFP